MIFALILGFLLLIIGIYGMLTQKNLIKIVIGFSIVDTGVHIIIVSIGYIRGKTAPIIDASVDIKNAVNAVVDPIPSALVLTAIVIGLAVTALMLSFVIKLYQKNKSLSIDDYQELKW
ncbi:MAG: cation:proton antiporter [Candidatus Cloacimonetes bacterium]|jgi:multicomponent Na+:H+ antiporter subunit C|nr:cation:proton antiporter [Candidatus Cloacimonadota bacterium]MBT4333143.1 cation:proton antiporter [Candidatus Cloacimonadota bacterium]MBT4575225.1 cation:proton antiporter [Candidatus Cloacimonadota bacterium]